MVAKFPIDIDAPGEMARYRLPVGVQSRLHDLLDRQDSGKVLSNSEREEATGLVELAELLTLLKLRADGMSG